MCKVKNKKILTSHYLHRFQVFIPSFVFIFGSRIHLPRYTFVNKSIKMHSTYYREFSFLFLPLRDLYSLYEKSKLVNKHEKINKHSQLAQEE